MLSYVIQVKIKWFNNFKFFLKQKNIVSPNISKDGYSTIWKCNSY